MADVRLVIHGHFYQPPRENPWTEEVAAEPSAAPYHDWNERITAECYRPNGWARVLDEAGRVEGIVNNYAHLSFDVGPTLMSWLERHQPAVYQRIMDADGEGRGAVAQAYNHAILPLANERDIRTQIRWGRADFAHRFGRPAEGMWLPETAVNDTVLGLLVEEGVRFTILAPGQATRIRPLDVDGGGDEEAWTDVAGGTIATGRPFRWRRSDTGAGDDRGIDVVFYDGPISHDLAFGLGGLSSQELVRRVSDAGADGTPVCVATDGETFGHHHKFADRALAFAFASEAPARGIRVLNAAELVRELAPTHEVEVRESAWSCAHGVGRWQEDCGCTTGAEPGWNQRWRAPLRSALDRLRDFGVEVTERRGPSLFHDVWAARDGYIEVLLGATPPGEFLAEFGVDGLDDAGAGRGPHADGGPAATRCSCTPRAAGSSATWPGSRPCRCCGTRPAPSTCSPSSARSRRSTSFSTSWPRQGATGRAEGDGRDALAAPGRSRPGRRRSGHRPPGAGRPAPTAAGVQASWPGSRSAVLDEQQRRHGGGHRRHRSGRARPPTHGATGRAGLRRRPLPRPRRPGRDPGAEPGSRARRAAGRRARWTRWTAGRGSARSSG